MFKNLYKCYRSGIYLTLAICLSCCSERKRSGGRAHNICFDLTCVMRSQDNNLGFEEDGLCYEQEKIKALLNDKHIHANEKDVFFIATRGIIIAKFVPEYNGATKGDLVLQQVDGDSIFFYTADLKYKWLSSYPGLWPINKIYD